MFEDLFTQLLYFFTRGLVAHRNSKNYIFLNLRIQIEFMMIKWVNIGI
jgi:hypothetical protein